MKFMNFLNYANPLCPINKLFQYRVTIWLEYYGELLKQVVIANPPRFLGAVMKIMSLFMPEKVLSRFRLLTNNHSSIFRLVLLMLFQRILKNTSHSMQSQLSIKVDDKSKSHTWPMVVYIQKI